MVLPGLPAKLWNPVGTWLSILQHFILEFCAYAIALRLLLEAGDERLDAALPQKGRALQNSSPRAFFPPPWPQLAEAEYSQSLRTLLPKTGSVSRIATVSELGQRHPGQLQVRLVA